MTAAGDGPLLEALAEALFHLTAARARYRPDEPIYDDDALWRLALELCGEPKPAFEPA